MRQSGVVVTKPLARVGGRPLLDWNVRILLHWGFREIVVSVADTEAGAEIRRVCDAELSGLVDRAGGALDVLVERQPLGNIGGASMLAGRAETVVAVFADNLTSLDLGQVVDAHAESGCALTLAIHEHAVTIPYGQVAHRDGRLTGFVEKPVIRIPVASGVSILSREALRRLPVDRPTGLAGLARMLLREGLPIGVFPHAEDWVDVNEADQLPAAEELLAQHRSILSW